MTPQERRESPTTQCGRRLRLSIARRKAKWQRVPQDAEPDGDYDGPSRHSVCLDAIRLARHVAKPVLVDDRFLQVLMYSDDPDSNSRAFSSAHFLLALLDAGQCNEDIVAADFHRLICWRYRFLVPPPALFLAWARESMDNLPGDTLLDVAVYLHDCLRDAGLHCGLEQSVPPMPMAMRLVTSWFESIAGFIAGIWGDSTFSDDAATRLTWWVGEELIPSSPLGLWLRPIGQNIARMAPNAAVRMAMVELTRLPDMRRASLGLRTLAEAVGLDEDTFLDITVETIHAIT